MTYLRHFGRGQRQNKMSDVYNCNCMATTIVDDDIFLETIYVIYTKAFIYTLRFLFAADGFF